MNYRNQKLTDITNNIKTLKIDRKENILALITEAIDYQNTMKSDFLGSKRTAKKLALQKFFELKEDEKLDNHTKNGLKIAKYITNGYKINVTVLSISQTLQLINFSKIIVNDLYIRCKGDNFNDEKYLDLVKNQINLAKVAKVTNVYSASKARTTISL